MKSRIIQELEDYRDNKCVSGMPYNTTELGKLILSALIAILRKK